MKKDFSLLHNFSVEEWYQIWIYVYIFSKWFIMQRVKNIIEKLISFEWESFDKDTPDDLEPIGLRWYFCW